MKPLLQFESIRTNVLNRRRTDESGDQCEVLDPADTLPQTEPDEVVPQNAGSRGDQERVIDALHPDAKQARRDHATGYARKQHHIAATAEDRDRQAFRRGVDEDVANILDALGTCEILRDRRQSQRVESLQLHFGANHYDGVSTHRYVRLIRGPLAARILGSACCQSRCERPHISSSEPCSSMRSTRRAPAITSAQTKSPWRAEAERCDARPRAEFRFVVGVPTHRVLSRPVKVCQHEVETDSESRKQLIAHDFELAQPAVRAMRRVRVPVGDADVTVPCTQPRYGYATAKHRD